MLCPGSGRLLLLTNKRYTQLKVASTVLRVQISHLGENFTAWAKIHFTKYMILYYKDSLVGRNYCPVKIFGCTVLYK